MSDIYRIKHVEEPNIIIVFGEPPSHISYNFVENRTIIKRIQWFLFCLIFPCKIEKFEDRKKDV